MYLPLLQSLSEVEATPDVVVLEGQFMHWSVFPLCALYVPTPQASQPSFPLLIMNPLSQNAGQQTKPSLCKIAQSQHFYPQYKLPLLITVSFDALMPTLCTDATCKTPNKLAQVWVKVTIF